MTIRNRLGSVSLAAFVTASPHQEPSGAPEHVELVELELSPGVVALVRGRTVRARVIGRYADGTRRDVSYRPETCWSSGDPRVASVTSSGLVIALRPGVTTVFAEHDGVRGELFIVVVRAA